MDIKGLTSNLLGKTQVNADVIKPSVASSHNAPHTNNPLTPQTLKAIQAMIQSLQLGKVFDVIVTRVEGSTVTLQVPGSPADAPVLQTQMKTPLPIGTRLTLQLTDDAAKPELKVIANPNSPQDAVSRHLRLSLQQQKAMSPLLANLALLAKSPGKVPAGLPDEIIETAHQLVRQIYHAVQIKEPQVLRQAMRQSGPFLEATLARQTLPATTNTTSQQQMPQTNTAIKMTDPAKTGTNMSQQARLELTAQTIQTISNAVHQQPVADVRANLLRLAAVIRAVTEQQAIQKNLAEAGQQSEAKLPTAKPPVIPLPASLTDSRASNLSDPTVPGIAGKPASGTTPQNTPHTINPPSQTAIRSQTPQPQAVAHANLAGILNRESALDELLGQVEGALARIHVHQLQTAATDQQHRPVWIMELPVRTEQGIDLFDMRIQRDTENHAAGDPQAPWTVSLAFELEKLGAIRAQITLYGEDRISTVFWAEQQETSTYFNQHLEKLEQRFKQVGLEVARLDCRCGKPDSPPASQEPRLVDEKV